MQGLFLQLFSSSSECTAARVNGLLVAVEEEHKMLPMVCIKYSEVAYQADWFWLVHYWGMDICMEILFVSVVAQEYPSSVES